MKKRLLVGMLGVVLAVSVAGCGAQEPGDIYFVSGESIESVQTEQKTEPDITDNNMVEGSKADTDVTVQDTSEAVKSEPGTLEQGNLGANTVTQEAERTQENTEQLTFADLSKFRFECSSGAGAWSEEFTIERDGYFTGSFYDADMGDTGEDYEGGTYYVSSYTGHFTDLVKIDEYTYQMKLADISYTGNPGEVDIKDNVRTFYTDTFMLDGVEEFTIYLPGTPLEGLPEDTIIGISMTNESDTELTMVVIENALYGLASCAYERLAPLEDAQMTYNTYKESYDYYSGKLYDADTTAEMVEYTATMYEYSDECLNYIWNLIRYNVEESEYQTILAEQRVWIQEKETAAQAAADEYAGGSLAAVSYNDVLARMTIERCEELLEYLK